MVAIPIFKSILELVNNVLKKIDELTKILSKMSPPRQSSDNPLAALPEPVVIKAGNNVKEDEMNIYADLNSRQDTLKINCDIVNTQIWFPQNVSQIF